MSSHTHTYIYISLSVFFSLVKIKKISIYHPLIKKILHSQLKCMINARGVPTHLSGVPIVSKCLVKVFIKGGCHLKVTTRYVTSIDTQKSLCKMAFQGKKKTSRIVPPTLLNEIVRCIYFWNNIFYLSFINYKYLKLTFISGCINPTFS